MVTKGFCYAMLRPCNDTHAPLSCDKRQVIKQSGQTHGMSA
jgi:hypothetical protein